MKIQKLVISCRNKKILKRITGQQPSPVFAKKSIANFSIREGQAMAFFVTLRKKRLRVFLERFCRVILPAQSRFQGFQTITKNDTTTTFTIGLPDCIPFLEMGKDLQDLIDQKSAVGLNLCFCTQKSAPTENLNDYLKSFIYQPKVD